MTEYAPPAGLLKRLMALVYDGFLVLALWFVTTGIFVLVYPKTGLPMEDINGVTRAAPDYLKGILLPLLLVETWLFYAWFWICLFSTSDAADDLQFVDFGRRRYV